MTTWINRETGEIQEGECPMCERTREDCEIQVRGLELEARKARSKITKLERMAEKEAIAKRDGATWKRLLDAWLAAFPDKRPTAKGIKSARATAVFQRLGQGATEQDFHDAILGAKEYPYVTFGKRTKTATKQSARMDDLQDIAAIHSDAMFDWLRDAGVKARGNAPF